jgi:hypothetical protein
MTITRAPARRRFLALALALTLALVFLSASALAARAADPAPAPTATPSAPGAQPANDNKKPDPGAQPAKPGVNKPDPGDNTSPILPDSEIYTRSGKILFTLFVIALLLESGLSVIFNWRVFLQLFDSRGVRTLVSLGFSWLIVEHFKFDAMTELINGYNGTCLPPSGLGLFVTALVISGGSSGVNKLLVALGFRSALTAEDTAKPMPPATEAWISVRLVRKNTSGPVSVLIGPDDATEPCLVGVISGFSPNCRALRFFLNDFGRFPPCGGYPLQPGVKYKLLLAGQDKNQQALSAAWGPAALAAGAMVDLEMTL